MLNKEKIVNLVGMLIIPLVLFAVGPFWNSIFSEKKSLEYQVLEKYHLRENDVMVPTKDWPRIKLIYKNNSIEDGTVISFSLTNTGDLPIKSDDFESNVVFETDSPDDLLEYAVHKAYPDNLSPKLKIVGNKLELQPLLLNPKDTITIDIFGRNGFTIKRANARISGIDSISEFKPEKYHGVMLVNAKEKGTGAISKERLMKLPAIMLSFLTLIFFVLYVITLNLYNVTDSIYFKSLFLVLSLSMLTIGAYSFHLLINYNHCRYWGYI